MNNSRVLIVLISFVLVTACNDSDMDRDILSPSISEAFPADQSTGIALDATISVVFDEELDPSSLKNVITLASSNGVVIGKTEYDSETFTIRFIPFENLEYYTVYRVNISNTIRDVYQNKIGGESLLFMTLPETEPARYEVTFSNTWSQKTHPKDFPANAHFSGLIGMTHTIDTVLFREGRLASIGIKEMAETGSKTTLISEIEQMITADSAQYILSSDSTSMYPVDVVLEFDIELSHPKVSIVSMIAPSPDWFIAVEGVELYEDGKWLSNKTVTVKSYDSGTDSGLTFTSVNEATNPFVPIAKINEAPLATGGIVPPLGTMKFKRIEKLELENEID
ncbi:spondin domain-containing protein [Reichenbachiella agarivorans]|uniref:Spondin domain-containing protein n=1 Tax=Reichenbachiella agarivorans TaxID=2979464 RepID=A0ABY6CMG1_9BACT|nr:spondin domain-containing protein [Reichenbachiella agarivorans]UXP31564.1 spondin domain-containing protein [Reichenbachiella agarivorans]